MTEDDARSWIAGRHGSPAVERVGRFLDAVIAENSSQNLISPASIPSIWTRHALDSAQLLGLAPPGWSTWMDVGTGGGFPGMIVALLAPDHQVAMVEPRRRRAEFLQSCVAAYSLEQAIVIATKVEAVSFTADVISARAVASTQNLLRAAGPCAKESTTWLLPRGRSGSEDAASAPGLVFHVEHSLTDPSSTILIGKGRVQ